MPEKTPDVEVRKVFTEAHWTVATGIVNHPCEHDGKAVVIMDLAGNKFAFAPEVARELAIDLRDVAGMILLNCRADSRNKGDGGQ